uniref:Peptidase S1 domain-containing protein n=1 Tax=Panagrolaimus sp. ES5 TaxID=591445 RepID=A0AC34FA67_9BILA
MIEVVLEDAIPTPATLKIWIEGICHNYQDKTCPKEDEGKEISAKTLYVLEEYYKKNYAISRPSTLKVWIEGICHNYQDKTCPEEDEGKEISAKTLYVLEEYYKTNCTSGDLAIVELADVIGDHGSKLSESLELPTSGDFMLSGFGEDPENPDSTGHELKTVTLNAEKCSENHGYYDSICTTEIDKDACLGDSGGALVDKNNAIIGVVSGGSKCSVMLKSSINSKSENEALKKWPGGVFTSTSLHFGFICDIVGSIQGCPKTFTKESYLTIV